MDMVEQGTAFVIVVGSHDARPRRGIGHAYGRETSRLNYGPVLAPEMGGGISNEAGD